MDDGHIWYLIIAILLLMGCCYFSTCAAAIGELSDSVLKDRCENGDQKALRLSKCLSDSHFVNRIQVAAWICGISATVLGSFWFHLFFLSLLLTLVEGAFFGIHVLSILCSLLLSAFGITVIGFQIPQLLGSHYCEKISFASVGFLRFCIALLLPLSALIRSFSGLIARLFGVDPAVLPDEVTEEEIRMMVDVGNEIGFIEESQKEMINNIFEFDDTTAGEVMTHRTDIIAVEKDAKISEIIYLAINEGFSRLPVYEGDLDNIIGLIYVKDLLCLVGCQSSEDFQISDFIRTVLYIPESTKCRALFAEFKKSKAHMAVVVDEYGGTAGIVSMEDLLESIVGDIEDEYDEQEEDIRKIDEDTYMVDGTADLQEVGELLQITFEEDEDFDTVGGLIIHLLGRIPKDSESPYITFGGYRFQVLSMDERRIDKVKIQRTSES